MPKWIFKKTSTDQQGVWSIKRLWFQTILCTKLQSKLTNFLFGPSCATVLQIYWSLELQPLIIVFSLFRCYYPIVTKKVCKRAVTYQLYCKLPNRSPSWIFKVCATLKLDIIYELSITYFSTSTAGSLPSRKVGRKN